MADVKWLLSRLIHPTLHHYHHNGSTALNQDRKRNPTTYVHSYHLRYVTILWSNSVTRPSQAVPLSTLIYFTALFKWDENIKIYINIHNKSSGESAWSGRRQWCRMGEMYAEKVSCERDESIRATFQIEILKRILNLFFNKRAAEWKEAKL